MTDTALELVAPSLAPIVATTPETLAAAFFAGRSARTTEAYRGDLAHFAQWIGLASGEAAAAHLIGLPHGPANGTALAYRAAMIDGGLAPATINRRLAALRSVVAFANTIGLIAWSLKVGSVKAQAYRDTRGPARAAFQAMALATGARTDPKDRRDHAIVRLLHDVALRRGEVVSLNLEHVDLEASRLSIMGKGRSEREWITLPAPTRRALAAWIAERGSEPGPLFPNFDRRRSAGRLTGRSVHRLIVGLGEAEGAQVRPHGLRHLAITTVLDRSGGNIRAAQRFSRHRDLRVLMIYDDNVSDLGGEMAALLAD